MRTCGAHLAHLACQVSYSSSSRCVPGAPIKAEVRSSSSSSSKTERSRCLPAALCAIELSDERLVAHSTNSNGGGKCICGDGGGNNLLLGVQQQASAICLTAHLLNVGRSLTLSVEAITAARRRRCLSCATTTTRL